jgi:diguanylate cyclase (GGDEF)-like protein
MLIAMAINFDSIKYGFKSFYDAAYRSVMRYRRGFVWIMCALVAAVVVILYSVGSLDRLELLTLDWRFNLRPASAKPSDIVFIDMAEDSVNAIGRWPWPRKWHAAIVKILSQYGPKAIAFDVVFSEPQDDVDDLAFEEALKSSGSVYLPVLYDLVPGKLRYYYRGEGVTAFYEPIKRFRSYTAGTGHINAIPDLDGILRRVPPLISYDSKVTAHFGIKIGADILGAREKDIVFYPESHRISIRLPGGATRDIPLDRNNQMIVDWVGPWGKDFRHYSYIDVIKSYARMKEGKRPLIDLNVFRGKICIIGLTATGLIDIKPIPISSAYPAVGTNAMVANSVLTGSFVRSAPEWVNILLIILISAVFTFCQFRMRFIGGMVLAICGMALYAVLSLAVFVIFDTVVVTFYPIFSIFISYVGTASFTHIMQSVERARLFNQATRDGLTHLYNIRHFSLLLEAEFRNAATFKFKPLSVIMGDIDNFKHANDTYGHQSGDIILKDVAAIIQSKCRQIDVVGRYGGEEFIVMLAGARAKDAAEVGDKIRTAIEAKKFKFGDAVYSTTISIGVAEYKDEKNKDELVGKADKALYHAKHTGRNRVAVYSPDMTGTG